MFNVAGVPMVENCIAGYNSCMFAYGQVNCRFHLLVAAVNTQVLRLHYSVITKLSASARLEAEKHIQCSVT
jgi:hypothetical protein